MYKGLREGRALFYIRLEINPAGNVDKDTSHVALDFSKPTTRLPPVIAAAAMNA